MTSSSQTHFQSVHLQFFQNIHFQILSCQTLSLYIFVKKNEVDHIRKYDDSAREHQSTYFDDGLNMATFNGHPILEVYLLVEVICPCVNAYCKFCQWSAGDGKPTTDLWLYTFALGSRCLFGSGDYVYRLRLSVQLLAVPRLSRCPFSNL